MAETSVYLPATVDISAVERIVAAVVPEGYTAWDVDGGVTFTPDDLSVAVDLYHRPEDEIVALAVRIRDEVKAQLGADGMTSRELAERERAAKNDRLRRAG